MLGFDLVNARLFAPSSRLRFAAVSGAVAAALALSACGASPSAKIEEAGGEAAANMGSAEPVQSPQSSGPAGTVVGFEPVSDVDETCLLYTSDAADE